MTTLKLDSPLCRIIIPNDTAWFFGQPNVSFKRLQGAATADSFAKYQTIVWRETVLFEKLFIIIVEVQQLIWNTCMPKRMEGIWLYKHVWMFTHTAYTDYYAQWLKYHWFLHVQLLRSSVPFKFHKTEEPTTPVGSPKLMYSSLKSVFHFNHWLRQCWQKIIKSTNTCTHREENEPKNNKTSRTAPTTTP